MANEFIARNGIIANADSRISGTLNVSGDINMGGIKIATESYVTTAIANLTDSAPDLLNTLNELAAALGDDPNFATTVTNNIATKLPLAGGTMTGNINWTSTELGLVWTMNTDGAYIKFFNTGDGDTNSRLEYATSDNGDEYHRFLVAGVERMAITSSGISATGYNKSNWDTAFGWGNNYISDVRVVDTNLVFTGEGGAYNESVDLSVLPFQAQGDYQPASTAITTSNIGSQSVSYASSAGNADTVDGYHASAFTKVPTWTSDTQSAYRSNFVSGGNWYRIANLGGERFFARVRIYDDSSGGPHSSVEFQVAGAFNNSGGYSFNLTSNGYYSAPSVTQVRMLSRSTYDPQYLEVYISYVGYVPATFVVSLLEARNASVVNWEEGSVPDGYSATTWDANAPLAVGGRAAIFNNGITVNGSLDVSGNINATGVISQTFWTNDSIRKLYANASLNFRTAAGPVEMILDGSGNLGIGTTGPSEHLSIEGTGDQALSIYSSTTGVQSTARTFIKLFGQNTASVKHEQVRIASAPGASESTAGQLIISTNNASGNLTERLRIDQVGNVGIGTDSPISKLHAYSSGTTFATIEAGGGEYAYLRLKTPSSGDGYIIKNLATGNGLLDKSLYLWNSNGPIQFVPNNTIANAVTINTSGNVGIGTNSPGNRRLVVSQATTDEWIAGFVNTGEWPYGVYIDTVANPSTAYSFATYTNEGTGFFIINNGNVGIGTTTPQVKLDVNGYVGIVGSNYLYFGHTTSNIGAWTTRQYSSGSTHYHNAVQFIFNNEGYGSYEHMRLTYTGMNLNGKQTIDSTDSWLRLNQAGDYGSGVYTPGILRSDGLLINYGGGRLYAGLIVEGNTKLGSGSFQVSTDQSFGTPGNYSFRDAVSIWNPNSFSAPDTVTVMSIGSMSNGVSLVATGQINASGGNSSQWNTAYSWNNHATAGYATTTYVDEQVAAIVDSAPEALNTLKELSNALGDDQNFATNVTNSIAAKVSKSGDTMTGNLTTTGLIVGNGVATGRQPYGPLANANIVLTSSASDSSGVCGIEFYSGNNYPSDGASIYFENNTAGGSSERAKLTIRVENDLEDHVEIRAGKVILNANTYSGGGQDPAIIFQHNSSDIASISSNGQVNASGGNSSQWNSAYGWGNHAGLYIPINPDGDGPVWEYSDANPTINGTSIGGRQSFGADGDAIRGGALQARLLNAYDGHVNSSYGYYVGDLNYGEDSGIHETTQVINSNGTFVGPNISTGEATIGRVLINYDGTDTWFRMQSGNRMRITTTGGTDFIIPNTGEMSYNGYTVWHAGNDGSGSGLDADTVDGIHASTFATRQDGARYSTDVNSLMSSGFYNVEGQPTNSPVSYGQIIVAKGIDTAFQIAGGYSNNALYFRGQGYGPESGGFYPWRRVWHNDDFSSTNISNWNTAYDWGNHANYGYWNTDLTEPKDIESTTVRFVGDVEVQGTFTESSSIRFKENIKPLEPTLGKVEQLNPVTYNKIGSEDEEIGLIAEEVAQLFPEVVTYNEEGQASGIQYQRLSVILLKAVQELTDRVNKLENK